MNNICLFGLGLVGLIYLSSNNNNLLTDKKVLVVDDIADTGHTLKDFVNENNIICTLHYHQQYGTPRRVLGYQYHQCTLLQAHGGPLQGDYPSTAC